MTAFHPQLGYFFNYSVIIIMFLSFHKKNMSSTLKSLKNKKNDGNNNFPPWTHEEKQKFVSGMFNIF